MLYATLQQIPLDLFKKVIQESISRTDFFKKFNMNPRGAKFQTFNKIVEKNSIDISHFIGGGRTNGNNRPLTKDEVLSRLRLGDNLAPKVNIKKYIMKFNILPYECVKCGTKDMWCDSSLVLQLDHINGNPLDNRVENLRFLCPNCHSQTSTFAGKNILPRNSPKCPLCESEISVGSRHCSKCAHLFQMKIEWPSDEELQKLVWLKPLIKLGKDLGVSDNAIRKRCKFRNILLPRRNYWLKNVG